MIFKDMYDGVANCLIKFAEDPGTMYGAIEDFLSMVGDTISDESSYLVSRRFYTYAKRIGYPVVLNSSELAVTTFKVDLPSGSILPAKEIGEEIHIPEAPVAEEVPREVPISKEAPVQFEQPEISAENEFERILSPVEKEYLTEELTAEEQETLKRLGGA